MKVLLIIVSILLSACSAGMSYHPWDSTWNLGYTDMPLGGNLHMVSYSGYNIAQAECDDYAMMRAAELTRSKGFRFFRILSERQSTQYSSFTTPSVGTSSGTVQNGRINTVGVSTAYTTTAARPTSTLRIEMIEGTDNAKGSSLDADLIWSALSKKYAR